jgi:hypothetical protein
MRLPLASRDCFPRDRGMGSAGCTITPSRSGGGKLHSNDNRKTRTFYVELGRCVGPVTSAWPLSPRRIARRSAAPF